MLIRLLLTTKSFLTRYSTTLLANFYMTRFLFDVKFWQMDHIFAKFALAIFCLICHCACEETATVVLLALTLYKRKFSVLGFVRNVSFGLILSHFGHFYFACAETATILLPV